MTHGTPEEEPVHMPDPSGEGGCTGEGCECKKTLAELRS